MTYFTLLVFSVKPKKEYKCRQNIKFNHYWIFQFFCSNFNFCSNNSTGGEEEEEEEDDSDDSDVARRGRSRRGHLAPVRRSSRTRRSRIDKEFSKFCVTLYSLIMF